MQETEKLGVCEVFRVFKDTVTIAAAEVVGYRALRGQGKESDELKEAIKRRG